jgi:hypothetical protein
MNDKERNYYSAFVRVRDFGAENAADFPAGSAGASNFASIGAAAEEMEQSGASQASGASGQARMRKDLALAELREDLRTINRTARALAVDDSAVGEMFRMPYGSSEQNLLSAARAFLNDATPLKTRFVEFGLPADFLEDLQADIVAFEQSASGKSAATGEKISATASIGSAVQNGLDALRRLRAIVENKYRVERAAKKKPETSPP